VAEAVAPRRAPSRPAQSPGSAADPLTLLIGAPPDARARLSRFDLTLAGTGAVGAAFAELLPAFGLGTVRLVDPDSYSPSNLRSQPITPEALGRPKCEVVGRRLKARSPETRVLVLHDRFERLAVADLHPSHAIALAGDNLALTVAASQRACQLGQLVIEGATHGPTCVAQVRSTAPAEGRERACPCCTWDQSEERELARQTRFACDGSGRALANPAGPTGALSALSAQAASMMAFELLRRILGLDDSDVIVESCALRRATVVSLLVLNPACRVAHAPWQRVRSSRPLGALSPSQLFALAHARSARRRATCSLEIEGAQWVSRGSCACPSGAPVARFVGRAAEAACLGPCARCGGPVRADPFHSHVEVPGALFAACCERPLGELGVPDARAAIVRGARCTCLVVDSGPPARARMPAGRVEAPR
jgi:molybdopterin/thiamine biosynthesis adenylyltransferase